MGANSVHESSEHDPDRGQVSDGVASTSGQTGVRLQDVRALNPVVGHFPRTPGVGAEEMYTS